MTEPTDKTNKTQINTSGGTYIEGNVQANEFVGRDKHVTVIHRLDLTDIRNQRNHKMLRQMVRSFWVNGVLKSSLYKEVLIRLNIEEKTDVVDNRPWDLILQQPGQPDNKIPTGTPIIDVFDQMNQLLLILGEPGSGKTTMLLELADELLNRAEADLTHPTPVVFNLSSWAEKRQPLAEWLVEELRIKYYIPKMLAQQWIEDYELLPLLDGLDEVKQEYRVECVKAINQFRQKHLVPLAVCSRTTEYKNLATQLRLQGGILVQPLALKQINDYLDTFGDKLTAIRSTLQKDAELQEMITTPLLLSVMVIAYDGLQEVEILVNGSKHFSHQNLFNTYIHRMFFHRDRHHFYSIRQTIRWLSWLAQGLANHQQTIFLIESLQLSWAKSQKRKLAFIPLFISLWGFIYGMIVNSFNSIVGAISFGSFVNLFLNDSFFSFYYVSKLQIFPYAVLWYSVVIGVVAVFIESVSKKNLKIRLVEHLDLSMRAIHWYTAIFWGAAYYLTFVGRNTWEHELAPSAFISPLLTSIVSGLVGGLASGYMNIKPSIFWKRSQRQIKRSLFQGILIGLLTGLSLIFIFGPTFRHPSQFFKIDIIENALVAFFPTGVIAGVIFGLVFEQVEDRELLRTRLTPIPNRGIRLSLWSVFKTIIGFNLTTSIFFLIIAVLTSTYYRQTAEQLRAFAYICLELAYQTGRIGGPLGGIISGGDALTKHSLLRLSWWWQGYIPWNYARFLDYCHDHLFLRKVGGGYIFIHRMLMEHFANMTNEDIERIAREVEVMKRA